MMIILDAGKRRVKKTSESRKELNQQHDFFNTGLKLLNQYATKIFPDLVRYYKIMEV